jgi:hypothetical protein
VFQKLNRGWAILPRFTVTRRDPKYFPRGKRDPLQTAVWLEHDQLKALRAFLERDGVPISEQIRKGVDLWLEKKKK